MPIDPPKGDDSNIPQTSEEGHTLLIIVIIFLAFIVGGALYWCYK